MGTNVLPQKSLSFVVFTLVTVYVCSRWFPGVAGSNTAESMDV